MVQQKMKAWPGRSELRRWLLAGLIAIGSPVVVWAANDATTETQSDEEPNTKLMNQAMTAFWWADFAEMERLYGLHKQPDKGPDLGPNSAYHQLRLVRAGFERVLNNSSSHTEPYLAELDALTLQWAQQNPGSALAHILHAEVLIKRAWAYRGGGFSNTVPPQAWADFEKYIKQARNYLSAHADVAFQDSGAHLTMLTVARASGWDLSRQQAIAEAGLKLNPADYQLYYRVLTSALPKWQGSTELVERYIRDVVAKTKPNRGMEMYTRLYANAANEHYHHRLFEDSQADWAKLKTGYEDMLKRDPRPYTRNEMAYFACLAKDKPVFIEQLDALEGSKPDLSAWGSNASYTYDTCKRWATQL